MNCNAFSIKRHIHYAECLAGSYGDDCAYTCGHCKGGITCRNYDGFCPDCAAGYKGDQCTTGNNFIMYINSIKQ